MSSSEVEEIKNRLNIAEVIGEYIRLTKAGSNWKALCPFHNEKTPSFMVSEERGSWHCFGCGKGGDAFSFVMELEGIGFREALERLAEKTGVELRRIGRGNWVEKGEVDSKKILFEILELATKWYEKNLWEGRGKEKILGYLRGRGLNDESIRKFRLGYAPEGWRNLMEFLQKKNYKLEDIVKTGLLVEKNNENKMPETSYQLPAASYYDRFRDRIIFPIQDIVGRSVGFSARVAPGGDEKNAKYVNTPQTLLYDKSKILYGLNLAKMEIKKRNETILVEGNTDVIASHQAGFSNAVAVSGTALTDEQVKILKRYGESIKMGFDMDAAGQAAARRSIKTCLENELDVKIIRLSFGKDAAETLREKPEIWKEAVERTQGVMEYYFEEIFSRYDSKKPTDKKKIAWEILNVIKDIANPIEQAHWVRELAEKIGTEEKILFEVLETNKSRKRIERGKNSEAEKEKPKWNVEAKALGIILAFPKECRNEILKIDLDDFQNQREKDIIKVIKKNKENSGLASVKAFFSDYETGKFLDEITFEAEMRFGGGENDAIGVGLDPVEELKGYQRRLKQKKIKEKIRRLTGDIKAAEASRDRESAKRMIAEFQALTEKMKE